jgi:Icc-related predicted phosphoesterase
VRILAIGEFILLTHDVPFSKLDKIRNRKSPINGEHIGDELYLDFDKRYQPIFHICGHMHENQGKARIRETVVVNPGYGREGDAAIISLPEKKVKFVKI